MLVVVARLGLAVAVLFLALQAMRSHQVLHDHPLVWCVRIKIFMEVGSSILCIKNSLRLQVLSFTLCCDFLLLY
jgi:hypothetical protein